jgi:GR25 family glycosyltransferase involved in LPS biosynthesis
MYFNYIEAAYYINLNKRRDRKRNFELNTNKFGLFIERFSAVELGPDDVVRNPQDNNWHIKISCTKSHFDIIKTARERGYKNCMIFEDDCQFCDDFYNKAQKCINDLKKFEWDILFFGGEPNSECVSITNNIVKTNGIFATHAYIINHTFYNKVLEMDFNRGIIDILYLNYPIEHKKFFLSKELLCWQDEEDISDLWNCKKDSKKIYEKAYKDFVK